MPDFGDIAGEKITQMMKQAADKGVDYASRAAMDAVAGGLKSLLSRKEKAENHLGGTQNEAESLVSAYANGGKWGDKDFTDGKAQTFRLNLSDFEGEDRVKVQEIVESLLKKHGFDPDALTPVDYTDKDGDYLLTYGDDQVVNYKNFLDDYKKAVEEEIVKPIDDQIRDMESQMKEKAVGKETTRETPTQQSPLPVDSPIAANESSIPANAMTTLQIAGTELLGNDQREMLKNAIAARLAEAGVEPGLFTSDADGPLVGITAPEESLGRISEELEKWSERFGVKLDPAAVAPAAATVAPRAADAVVRAGRIASEAISNGFDATVNVKEDGKTETVVPLSQRELFNIHQTRAQASTTRTSHSVKSKTVSRFNKIKESIANRAAATHPTIYAMKTATEVVKTAYGTTAQVAGAGLGAEGKTR